MTNAARLMSAHRVSAADEADFYPTPPWGARAVGELIRRLDPVAVDVWEPAVGEGHMAYGLQDYFPVVHCSDAFDYGATTIFDFASDAPPPCEADWIATNPPFNQVEVFIRLGLKRARRGLALLVRAAALESVGRYRLLFGAEPLSVFAPFIERLPMHKGRWEPEGSTAAFYAVLVWLKPAVGVVRAGHPAILPIPPGSRRRLTRADDALRWGVS